MATTNKVWDTAAAARTMARFDFVAEFTLRMTRKAANRSVVDGYELRKRRAGWTYGYVGGVDLMVPTRDTAKLYDVVRRSPLGHFTRMADEFRAEVAA